MKRETTLLPPTTTLYHLFILYKCTEEFPMRWFNRFERNGLNQSSKFRLRPQGSNPSPVACEAEAMADTHRGSLPSRSYEDDFHWWWFCWTFPRSIPAEAPEWDARLVISPQRSRTLLIQSSPSLPSLPARIYILLLTPRWLSAFRDDLICSHRCHKMSWRYFKNSWWYRVRFPGRRATKGFQWRIILGKGRINKLRA